MAALCVTRPALTSLTRLYNRAESPVYYCLVLSQNHRLEPNVATKMMWKLVFPALAVFFTLGLGALVGGPRDIDVTDPGMLNALNFAVAQHNRGTNDLYLSQVAEVVKAQSQVSDVRI